MKSRTEMIVKRAIWNLETWKKKKNVERAGGGRWIQVHGIWNRVETKSERERGGKNWRQFNEQKCRMKKIWKSRTNGLSNILFRKLVSEWTSGHVHAGQTTTRIEAKNERGRRRERVHINLWPISRTNVSYVRRRLRAAIKANFFGQSSDFLTRSPPDLYVYRLLYGALCLTYLELFLYLLLSLSLSGSIKKIHLSFVKFGFYLISLQFCSI